MPQPRQCVRTSRVRHACGTRTARVPASCAPYVPVAQGSRAVRVPASLTLTLTLTLTLALTLTLTLTLALPCGAPQVLWQRLGVLAGRTAQLQLARHALEQAARASSLLSAH